MTASTLLIVGGNDGIVIDLNRRAYEELRCVKDLVIVDTPDALLIADRSRSQEVGELVKRLEKRGRDELL